MNPNPPINRPSRPIDPSQFRPQRRVFDIARPGRTPASSTSRPIAQSHKPMVQDMSMRAPGMSGPRPMLNPHPQHMAPPSNGMDIAVPQPPAAPSPQHRVAPPLAPPSAPRPAAPAFAAPASPRPIVVQPQAPPQPQPRPIAPSRPSVHPAAFTPAPHGMEPGIHNDLAVDVAKVDPIQLNDDEPVLISKHMPKDGSAKWRWIIAASLVFLFLLVVFDILLDADFITLRQMPHTHFF